MTEVILFRRGLSVGHHRCELCQQLVKGLSARGYCAHCEWLDTEIGKRVRAKLDPVGWDGNGSPTSEVA